MGNERPLDIERMLREGNGAPGQKPVVMMELRTGDGQTFRGTPEQLQVQVLLWVVEKLERVAVALERAAPGVITEGEPT